VSAALAEVNRVTPLPIKPKIGQSKYLIPVRLARTEVKNETVAVVWGPTSLRIVQPLNLNPQIDRTVSDHDETNKQVDPSQRSRKFTVR
jgi:hypothetical protein